ncbi:MAG TPA: hypothetical protein VHX61_11410 [Rhizomicrobium sp.]|nr:hypothetical protein [Rhizomicrobium sp.]
MQRVAFKARGIIFLTPEARFQHLRDLPEGANIGRALNDAMRDIEDRNPELADALPKNYQEVPNCVLIELIKLLDPVNLEGDAFGRVYEFMMGKFAMQEMQKGRTTSVSNCFTRRSHRRVAQASSWPTRRPRRVAPN